MKMHDDLRERLRRGVDTVGVPGPSLRAIERRAGARRTRRVAGTVVASAVLAVAVVAPLVALLAVDGDEGRGAHPGEGSASQSDALPTVTPLDPTQNVLGVGECAFDNGGVRLGVRLTASEDPLDVCQAFWRTGDPHVDGVVSVVIPEGADPVAHDSDLPLVVCAGPGPGRFQVLVGEGTDVCASSGMWPVPPEAAETLARWESAQEAFSRRAFPETSGSCTDGSTAIRVVREELEAHGFTAWRVVDSFEPNSPNGSCAAYGVDHAEMEVKIVNDTVS